MDRETGKSKGFGFVTFDPDARDAVPDAIQGLNNNQIDGREPEICRPCLKVHPEATTLSPRARDQVK